jgi:hypothetical protein
MFEFKHSNILGDKEKNVRELTQTYRNFVQTYRDGVETKAALVKSKAALVSVRVALVFVRVALVFVRMARDPLVLTLFSLCRAGWYLMLTRVAVRTRLGNI